MKYNYLLPFCDTDRQREVVSLISEIGQRNAAEKLGISRTSIQETFYRVKKRAALKGVSPETDIDYPLSPVETLKGRSSLIDKTTGETRLQWVKTTVDDEKRIEVFRAAVDAFKEDLPRYDPVSAPKHFSSDLMSVYAVTDYHFGMKAWHEETGADWDLSIAEDLLTNWFARAIQLAPNSEKAVFAQLGDFLHFDSLEALTPQNKHLLDVDSRFQKVVRVVIRVVRRIVTMLLEKHKTVYLLFLEGNHDPASSAWLREMLAAVYSEEPRVIVETSPDCYYCIEHGLTSLFFHHGHKRKVDNIDDVFVSKYRQVFGRTKYSYAHLGHLHSNELKETNLMQIERHRTLAAPDSYASKGGWSSGRDAKVITYSAKYGEVARLTISPEMVK